MTEAWVYPEHGPLQYNNVMTMVLVQHSQVRYVQGSYPVAYNSFLWLLRVASPVVYSPGYYRDDRLVGVKTNIYGTSDGKLVWSGLSQTTNPTDTRKLVGDTAKAVRSAMKKYGFIS